MEVSHVLSIISGHKSIEVEARAKALEANDLDGVPRFAVRSKGHC